MMSREAVKRIEDANFKREEKERKKRHKESLAFEKQIAKRERFISDTNRKLLRCPFCGGKAVIGMENLMYCSINFVKEITSISCSECGVGMIIDNSRDGLEELIGRWNRRIN